MLPSYSAYFAEDKLNSRQVLDSLNKDAGSYARNKTINDTGMVRQFAAIRNEKIIIVTRPISTDEDALVCASFGDKASHVTPISFKCSSLNKSFISLTEKQAVANFKLPTVSKEPTELEHPDKTQVSPESINFPFDIDDNSPAFVVFPQLLPIPIGVSIPTTHLADFTLEDCKAWPVVYYWAKAAKYLLDHNGGQCLSAGDSIFKAIDVKPEIKFNKLSKGKTINLSEIVMLDPDDYYFNIVFNTIAKDIESSKKQPEMAEAPVTSNNNNEMVEILAKVLGSNNLAKAPTSQTDKDNEKELQDIVAKYKLFFAKETPVFDPDTGKEEGTIVTYPDLSEEFIVRNFVELAGWNMHTPLAIYKNSSNKICTLAASDIEEIMRDAAANVYNINPDTVDGKKALQRWSAHSLRVGACVILYAVGFTGEQIQFILRWKSLSFMVYLRNLAFLSQQQNRAISQVDDMPNFV
jgi:hypothetical protein